MIWTPLSQSKGQGHQAALLSAALTLKAAAAVSVGTYSAWESTATLRLLGGARGAGAPTGRRGAGHIVSPRAQLVWNCCQGFLLKIFVHLLKFTSNQKLLQQSKDSSLEDFGTKLNME